MANIFYNDSVLLRFGMGLINIWDSIVNSGVASWQTYTFSGKLITRNKLAIFCALFSFIYVVFFYTYSLYLPLLAIVIGITMFLLSIILNKYQKFNLSSLLILINTNYCVLFFSIYLGFDSGIHLYLFTSPLIILTSFDTKKIRFIALAMVSYLINFAVISVVGKNFGFQVLELTDFTQNAFYFVNFSCSTIILFTLSLYFLFNNNKINQLIAVKNEELLLQQQILLEENKNRKEAENCVKESLAQKEVLLSEIHHRVKNNLAVINGLLELQSAYLQDKNAVNIIKESQNRIKSIALLHEKLYENKTLDEVNLKTYTDQLIDFIKISLTKKDKQIIISTNIDTINLAMDKAMPFALIINELISNSYKHAFKTKNSGQIFITFVKNKEGYILNYSDDGIGFEYSENVKKNSLGLNLIETFSQQLKGKTTFLNNGPGMEFKLQFD